MDDILLIHDHYKNLGITTRTITEGKEINLVRKYIDYRSSTFKPQNDKKLAIFLEAKINNAYPDIVFVEYNPNNYEKWNSHRETLDKADLKVLYHIYQNKALTSENIVQQLGLTWKSTLLSLEKLFDSELITRKFQSWIINNENTLGIDKIEAYEAKISKWEEVLQQTILNKNFASESYGLFYKSPNEEEILKKFKRFGIGICVDSGEKFKVVKKAKHSEIPVSFNSIIFNEWIGRIINMKGTA